MRPPLPKLILVLLAVFPSNFLLGQSGPNLISVSPTSGVAGNTQVTLTGTGFGSTPNAVVLGDYLGEIVSWSDTQVVATVHPIANSGVAEVVITGGTASNQLPFTVLRPNLTSVSPTAAEAGQQVTLTGTNFGSTPGTVVLGSYLGIIVNWTDTQIVATVSGISNSGNAYVVNSGGAVSNDISFTVLQPTLTGLTNGQGNPINAATVGQTVNLNGTGFGATQGSVMLGTYLGNIVSWSDTQVTATVNGISYTGNAYVVNSGGAASNVLSFTVLRPVITSITPSIGAAGTSLTIAGTGFGSPQGSGTLTFARSAVAPASWNDTSLTATAPAGVVTSFVQVTSYGTASNNAIFRAPTSNFTPPSGSMQSARWAHRATVLTDGRVLITGGVDIYGNPVAGAEVYDPSTGSFSFYPLAAFAYSTATLLDNGQVLVAGGIDHTGTPNASAWLFNPQSNTFTQTGSLNSARFNATATLLGSGQVLLAGGTGANGTLASAELYDPGAQSFSLVGSLNNPRNCATATLLNSGQVLIAGGYASTGWLSIASAELYDPAAQTFSNVGSMNIPRAEHTATLLNNGQVLIAGGIYTGHAYLSAVELFDPASNTFHYIGTSYSPCMTSVRYMHSAVLLNNGKVLLAGGFNNWGDPVSTAELYDPSTQTFSADGSMNELRGGPAIALLASGQVLVVGGYEDYYSVGALSNAELYQTGAQTASATALSVGPNPSTYGSLVTFTATVTPPAATGTVTFYDSFYPQGTANVGSNGQATFTTTTLYEGSHTISAWYQGDANNLSSTSSVVLVTINQPTLTITASSASMTQGGTVPTITPSYSGFVGGDTPSSLTTQPTCTTTTNSNEPGTYPSTCSGAVDSLYIITYVPGTVTVTAPPSISGLSPSAGPVGTVVTISGANFGATEGSSTVDLNGTPVTPNSWSDDSIGVPVQADASPVVVTVTVNGAQSNSWNFTVTAGAGTTVLTDSMGRETFYGFQNLSGRNFMTAVGGTGCASCGSRGNTLLTYDALGNNLASTDALNNTTAYTYDSNGNVLTKTQYLNPGTPLTWSYTYNSFQEVLTATDPAGNVTTNVYDANGNLLSTTTPPPSGSGPGLTTNFQYNTLGELTQVTDPNSHSTTLTYTTTGGTAPAGLVASITDAQNHTTTFTYDARGNRLTSTDALSQTTTYTYDSMNRLWKITAPDQTYTQFAYDYRGRRTSVTDANGKITTYGYDDADRLTSVTDAALNLTIYGYDTENNMVDITDAASHQTSFGYDALGRVTSVTFPSTLSEGYTYDSMNNLLSKTDRKGQTISYGYDPLYRLTSKSYPDQTGASYTYDPLSRLTLVTDSSGNYSFSYDNLGRLTGTGTQYSFLSTPLNNSYGYDAASNRVSFTNPQSGITNYSYDSLNRLASLTDPNTGEFDFGYDVLGRRTSLTRPNGVDTSYSYDNLSRLLSVLHGGGALPGSTSYTYDNAGNRLTKTAVQQADPDPVSVLSQYSYDNIYELTQAVVNGSVTEGYSYDAVGNRLTSAGPTSYNYNTSNELTSSSAATFTYDNNGNTLSKTDTTGTTQYAWDFENRLTSVILPGTGGTVNFKYDPFGRRIEKVAPTSGTTIYAYDGDNITAELGAAGNVLAQYTQGEGIDEPLALTGAGGSYFYHADGLGSIASVTDGSGQLAASYVYDSFGKLTSSTGTVTNPLQYTAREFDTDTGLYYYRARYYDPNAGRFLTEDPIRIAGGIDFYTYVTKPPQQNLWVDSGSGRRPNV